MNARKKDVGPAPSVEDLSAAMSGRYGAPPPPVVEQQHDQAPAEKPSRPRPPSRSGMVTRSWYLPREVAEQLAAAADQVAAGLPGVTKHAALAALIAAGVDQADAVRARLAQQIRDQL